MLYPAELRAPALIRGYLRYNSAGVGCRANHVAEVLPKFRLAHAVARRPDYRIMIAASVFDNAALCTGRHSDGSQLVTAED
jgi:hypothetical protein